MNKRNETKTMQKAKMFNDVRDREMKKEAYMRMK